MQELNEILVQRQQEYGGFEAHSALVWRLYLRLGGMTSHAPWERSAGFMVCFKLARALLGDHTKRDTWLDLAGYARLAADLATDPADATEYYAQFRESKCLPQYEGQAARLIVGALEAIGRGANSWAMIERAALGVLDATA
jgi:hypothetical protein